LEFSPYWARTGYKISNEEFLAPDVWTSVKQNFSFSLSSTQSFLINDTIKTKAMGFGLRTMLWQGSKAEKEAINYVYRNLLTTLGTENILYTRVIDKDYPKPCEKKEIITKVMKGIEDNKKDIFGGMNSSASKNWIAEFKDELDKHLPELDYSIEANRDTIQSLLKNFIKVDSSVVALETLRRDRKGFKLELASALALSFPTNSTDFSMVPRVGVWLTPSFQPFKKSMDWLEVLGVLRYYWYNPDFTSRYSPGSPYFQNTFDRGLKVALKWQKFRFEFEGTARSSSVILKKYVDSNGNTITTTKSNDDTQYIGTLIYQVKDNIKASSMLLELCCL
jgi:hypothetical protein